MKDWVAILGIAISAILGLMFLFRWFILAVIVVLVWIF